MYELLGKTTQDHIEQVLLQEAIAVINNPTRGPYIKTNKLAKKTDYRTQELGRVCSEMEWLERQNGQSKPKYRVTEKVLDHPDVKST
ncbi:hypothetical protein [Natrarchaeobaculum aegyptiacum]|uniref:Uncharacterized protein n=1 Tax=Natrarchaeobaculum aegyptiacum TaxID=745377 RepID=A0A2Z2HX78_9EURY|nr:hypothetical protein [Natrarchaeobaculum aegyptiacum]ARS90795.1 hypothetical protein B1756_14405 [Natrarchaeobaculum aegyptiacum]